jgi:protein tyrosine/serine phosphatase
MQAPANEQIWKVLGVLDDSSQWPVFVHCRRGKDRTGVVLACYRIVHDHWENQKALQEARLAGMSWIERAMQNYILRFQPAGKPAPLGSQPQPALSAQ